MPDLRTFCLQLGNDEPRGTHPNSRPRAGGGYFFGAAGAFALASGTIISIASASV